MRFKKQMDREDRKQWSCEILFSLSCSQQSLWPWIQYM